MNMKGNTIDDWAEYKVTVHHDQGIINIKLRAPDIASAVRTVVWAERCPERAIKNVKRMSS